MSHVILYKSWVDVIYMYRSFAKEPHENRALLKHEPRMNRALLHNGGTRPLGSTEGKIKTLTFKR